jgi:hypothetical protein
VQFGGGVALASSVASSTLNAVTATGNTASLSGAVVYADPPASLPTVTAPAFSGSVAPTGGQAQGSIATSAHRIVLRPDHNPNNTRVAAGKFFAPVVNVTVYDAFNHVVAKFASPLTTTVPTQLTTTVQAPVLSSLLLTRFCSCGCVQSALSVAFANGQALMPLVLLGPSGSSYSMSLAASFTRLDGSLAALPSLKLAFAVRTCLPGETYQNLVCLDCPPGMRISACPSRCTLPCDGRSIQCRH